MVIFVSLFPYGNPRIEMGIDVFSIPVWKRGVPDSIWARYHMVIHGNPRIGMGIDVISIPVWKWGVGNFGFLAKIFGGAPVHP